MARIEIESGRRGRVSAMVAVSFMVLRHKAQIFFRKVELLDGRLSGFALQYREGRFPTVAEARA
jgi:hypothetical protein